MKRTFLGLITSALTLASGFSKDSHLHTNDLTIRVLDYVGLENAARAELETNAVRILSSAGIAIGFIECYSAGLETGREGCTGPLGPTDVVLRVFQPKLVVKGEQLGYAAMTPEGGAYITVFIDPAQEKARVGGLSNGVFLGHVVAHEIGHLLLGPSSHSPAGIMRSKWRPVDEEWMVKRALLFDASQSKNMRSALATRVGH